MDAELIKRHNSKVQQGDTVYYIGDMFFYDEQKSLSILKQLNGKKILVYGNHDKAIRRSKVLRDEFVECRDKIDGIYIQEQFIVLDHYAHLTWNKSHRGAWMLHGHSHGGLTYPIEGKILDVGVDGHNYYPISFKEVKKIMDSKTTQPVDHHM